MMDFINEHGGPQMVYLGLAIFCTGWFLVQFLLSTIWGDLEIDSDIDTDVDTDTDFDLGSIISFKGIIHFGIGYSWWMYLHAANPTWNTHAAAFLIGALIMVVLYLTYWGAYKLRKEIIPEKGEELVGRYGEIYLKLKNDEYIIVIIINGASRQLQVSSSTPGKLYPTGYKIKITSYIDGKYYIN